MTKSYYKPPTRIDQARIIEPETWQDQLKETLERDPECLNFFYIPVHVAISNLPADVLYAKIIEDMQFLREKDTQRFKRCVQSFDEQHQKYLCVQDAEIIQFEGELI